MKALRSVVFLSLCAALLGAACSSGSPEQGASESQPTTDFADGSLSTARVCEPLEVSQTTSATSLRTPAEVEDPYTYFTENVSPQLIQGKCIGCHVSGSVAQATPLVYTRSGNTGFQESNYQLLVDYIETDPARAKGMLEKAQGVNHGGGPILEAGSSELQTLRTFLEAIGGQVGSSPVEGLSAFWANARLDCSAHTLRRAALIVARRLPTQTELQAVESGTEESLRSTLRSLMNGEGFHEFLIDGANDRLHLKAFDNGLFLEAADLNATPLFPLGAQAYYEAGDKSTGGPAWYREWFWGMTHSPLELIAYIVENDRSYQEVVTADYTMVNPIMDEFLRSNTGLTREDSHQTYRPGKNRGQVLRDDQLQSEFTQDFGHRVDSYGDFLEYPHAGILNTHAFLNRYPTTETNRNRARSRWTYYHFLGVDIEKSATRTTDPVALADTNNPTLYNPACTVCHELLDPVAGAFQNYGNAGLYRDSWGGTDALPDTYKHPEWFDDEAEPSPYIEGDTWFRDMRVPGFKTQQAPDAARSLQWLGRKIAEDERFATAAIKFWWPALMGEDVKTPPEASEDLNFEVELAAFTEQNRFIETLGSQFAEGINGGRPYNAKDLFVELLMSPWFRANSASAAASSVAQSVDIGARRLLTPAELEAKSQALLGWKWGQSDHPNPWDYDGEWTQLNNRFRIYYGGTDSNGIKERSRALTSLMANVAEKQAVEMACPAVVIDFDRSEEERLLFQGLDRNTTPASQFSDTFEVTGDSFENRASYRITGRLPPGAQTIKARFLNDWSDETEGDRNLHLARLSVTNGQGKRLLLIDDTNRGASTTFTCGSERDGMSLWCSDGYVSVPLEVTEADTYTIEVSAWGDQAGPEAPLLAIGVESDDYAAGTSAGARAIKRKLIELHEKFLGESLTSSDAELAFSYQLLVETWEDRAAQENASWAWSWPNETCRWYSESQWQEGGVSRRANDSNHMLYTWTSLLIYLMTDFYYLHE